MFQNVHDSLSKRSCEVVENEMWINFRHVWKFLIDIVSQHYILQSNVNRRPNREMTDDHTIRLASMLMQHNHIRKIFVSAQVNQIFQDITTSVDSFSIGDDNGHFLQELQQSRGRVTRSGDQNLWVCVKHVAVLVINVCTWDYVVDVV